MTVLLVKCIISTQLLKQTHDKMSTNIVVEHVTFRRAPADFV